MIKHKIINKGIIGLIIFGEVFLSVIIINNQSGILHQNDEIILPKIIKDDILSSGYWNLTGTPIIIDDTAPYELGSMNWSDAVAEDWCNGAGTWDNPYTIENVTIKASSSENCITIKDSTAFFKINNCSLYNALTIYFSGILLENATNGNIINNQIFDSFYGIKLNISSNITIQDNIMEDCISGIVLFHSDINYVEKNTAQENSGYGIFLVHSSSNNIIDNDVKNNLQHGILIYNGSKFNYIYNNYVFQNSFNGIHISYTESNLIVENNIISNTEFGLYLNPETYNNTIRRNIFENNGYGCYRDEGTDNIFEDNTCFNPFSDLVIWILTITAIAGVGFIIIIIYRKKKIENRA